jgi:hypothetical protein
MLLKKLALYDDSVKSPATMHACMQVVSGLIDTPHMRHEVARRRHENAECGSVVRAAKQRNHASS